MLVVSDTFLSRKLADSGVARRKGDRAVFRGRIRTKLAGKGDGARENAVGKEAGTYGP